MRILVIAFGLLLCATTFLRGFSICLEQWRILAEQDSLTLDLAQARQSEVTLVKDTHKILLVVDKMIIVTRASLALGNLSAPALEKTLRSFATIVELQAKARMRLAAVRYQLSLAKGRWKGFTIGSKTLPWISCGPGLSGVWLGWCPMREKRYVAALSLIEVRHPGTRFCRSVALDAGLETIHPIVKEDCV